MDAEKAVVRAEQLLDEGATLIDVGGNRRGRESRWRFRRKKSDGACCR